MADKTIMLPAQRRDMALDAALEYRVDSFNEAENTIEVVWTTGAKVRRFDWRAGEYFDEELVVDAKSIRTDRLNRGAPFLDTHDSWDLSRILGSVVKGSVRIERGIGLATIRLSRAPDVASAVQKIREGDAKNISVGYNIHRVEKTEGSEGDVALWRVVDWEPFEISAVPIPADAGSQVRSAGRAPAGTAPEYPCAVIDHRSANENTAAALARMRMRAAASRA